MKRSEQSKESEKPVQSPLLDVAETSEPAGSKPAPEVKSGSMATAFKEGDRVKVVSRKVTEDDRKTNAYFEHMAGLTGVVQNVYGANEIAVKVELESLSKVTNDVHKESIKRMREKFLGSISEEQKKQLTSEELNFDAHYMMLVRGADLEKVVKK